MNWLRRAGFRNNIDQAITIAPPHFVDDDELLALERRHLPFLFERFADGTLLITPPCSMLDAVRSTRLSTSIAQWAVATAFGVTLGARAGCKFSDNALLSPDAMVIQQERWDSLSHEDREGFPAVLPVAMFEMLTNADCIATTLRKANDYLRYGVPLVVFLDVGQSRVCVGRVGDAQLRDVGDVDGVDCSPVLPGFVLDVAAIKRLN